MPLAITWKNTAYYVLGCLLIALGVVMMIRADIGTSPWDALHVAMGRTTPLTIGASTIVVAATVTLFVTFVRRRAKYLLMGVPIVLVGAAIDLFDLVIFASFWPDPLVLRSALFALALSIMPLGGALLIISTYPAGVFDESMYALMHLFKTQRLVLVRIIQDATPLTLALIITWITHRDVGTVGIGTLTFVVLVGPLLKTYVKTFRRYFMKLNKMIDHTYLKPVGTKEDIDALLEEAIEYDFKSVCVNPTWVAYASESLKKSDVLVCTVIGFPLGASTTRSKVYETEDALRNGAHEIDMVVNVGWVKAGRYGEVEKEVKAIKDTCGNRVLKVILETCYLTDDEIRQASEACFAAGADFVKTSTGFGSGGATLHAVKIMADVAKGRGVKASGGVKTREDVEMMIEAGATRIGTSSGVKLMQGKTAESDY